MRLASAGGALTSAGARVGMLEELDVEDEHALRPVGLSLVGERFGNPEAALLADHHQLNAFGPAGDDSVQRKGGRRAADDRAVEHLAVGRPTRVVDRDDLVRPGTLFSRARLQHEVARPDAVFARIFRRSGDVRWRWNHFWSLGGQGRGGQKRERERGDDTHESPFEGIYLQIAWTFSGALSSPARQLLERPLERLEFLSGFRELALGGQPLVIGEIAGRLRRSVR